MKTLAVLGIALAYSVLNAGTDPVPLALVAAGISLVAAAHWLGRRREFVPALRPSIRWAVVLFTAYMALELVPLPVSILGLVPGERSTLLQALTPVSGAPVHFTPLAIAPVGGVHQFLRLGACMLLLLLIREVAWSQAERPWLVTAPVLVVGAAVSLLGTIQFYVAGTEAHGTWPNRNHFADFLAMCLPFSMMMAIDGLKRRREEDGPIRAIAVPCVALAITVVLLAGVVHSLSRMGFASAIAGLFISGFTMSAGALKARAASVWVRLLAAGCLLSAVVAGFFLLAPSDLITRFDELEFSDGIKTQDRIRLWRESLPLIPAYPVFGTGPGGYEAAFLRYKITDPMVRDRYAHNDYLQYLIELGPAGFALAAALAASVIVHSFRVAAHPRGRNRAVAAACCGAFGAILLHSTVDFSLFIPANGFLLAWIAGIACSLPAAPSGRRLTRRIAPAGIASPLDAGQTVRQRRREVDYAN